MLREPQPARLQKVLADSLRYAVDLQNSDLQNCDLSNGYLGQRRDTSSLDISGADLFEATCVRTSFKNVTAVDTVFYRSNLERAVFKMADCRRADFREAELDAQTSRARRSVPAKLRAPSTSRQRLRVCSTRWASRQSQ